MSPDNAYADPFEAFKRKKQEEQEKTAAPAPVPGHPARADGRPRGFSSHRADFGKVDPAAAPAPAEAKTEERPKGFKSHRVDDGIKKIDEELKPPSGFKSHRLT